MKYYREYNTSINMEHFIRKVRKIYPGTKLQTIKRRYYDCRKEYNRIQEEEKKLATPPPKVEVVLPTGKYADSEMVQPNMFKMLTFKDMKEKKFNVRDRIFMKRYGFNDRELNWLEQNGYLQ